MTMDDDIRGEKIQLVISREQQKYQHYHQVKLTNMNISSVNKYCHLNKVMLEQAKFTQSPSGKAVERQIKIKSQGESKNKVKATEKHGKQLVQSNASIKKRLRLTFKTTNI